MRAAPITYKTSLAAAPLGIRVKISPVAVQHRNFPPSLQAPKAPRLRRVCYANKLESVESKPQLEEEEHGPFHSVSQVAGLAHKFVFDAWSLIQKLVELVQRVRLAAAAIQTSSESRSVEGEQTSASTMSAASSTSAAPLQLLSAATLGAVTHLRQTLTDDSGTLEAKWRALESTARQQMGGLFTVTRASAEALDKLQASSGDAAERLWNQQSAAAVVEEEEALKRQVFSQVFAELNAQAKRDGNNFVGYSAAY